MSAAPQLIAEFPAAEVRDAPAAQAVLAAAREAAAVAAGRAVPLLLPEAHDGGQQGLDPSVLAGILAADLHRPNSAGTVTTPAGAPPWLVVTAGTSRNAPYNLARRIQTLNRITGGRVGLFLQDTGLDPVTAGASSTAGVPGTGTVLGRGPAGLLDEYVQVLRRLWASFPEEALIGDRDAGRFACPHSLVPASFDGDIYAVAGALNVPLPCAHRTLLLANAAPPDGTSVDGVIGHPGTGTAPAYRTLTWLPAGSRREALRALEKHHGVLPAAACGAVPAISGASGVVVSGAADDVAQVLRDAAPAPTLLRVRAGASAFPALLNGLFDVLPAHHETRNLQIHAG